MGYMELKGTNKDSAQAIFQHVLDRQDTITMVVLGLDQKDVAMKARAVADHEPNIWWVVWVQNPRLLKDEQRRKYRGSNEKAVACVLSVEDKPVKWLSSEEAKFKDILLEAFLEAQSHG